MAVVTLSGGRTEVVIVARGRGNRIPPELLDAPGGLYPMKSAAFEVDEYRIMSGWPVPVPACDIRIECLVSADGSVLGDRGTPTSLFTDADMRWVADVDYYDQVSGRWMPFQGTVPPWEATPTHLPTLVTDYEYRVGDERFVNMTALNFDSNTGDYLTNDLGIIMGGATGYTVIMVLNPNSIYGNDLTVPDNALWGPAVDVGAWEMFTVKDQAVYLTTESRAAQKGVPLGGALSSTAPTYLALVVGRPKTTLYAASGPSRVLVSSLAAGEVPEPLSTSFWLGNAPFATSATMDMALMDLSIYGNMLSKAQVVREITALSAIYGGDT